MLGSKLLLDPDGNVVVATAEGAEVLRDEHGYTDAPAGAESLPAPAPSDPGPGDGPGVPPKDDPQGPDNHDEPKVADPAAPRGNASRDAWVAYAEQVGLQVADDDSREDIKAAVAALEG
ncbi:hypothetical protein [Patulibacter sp. SYSU D01012]|uniref:hypothetical protein n=1 Tax=Patulibacter sp. SYSU D01012 TaxID=2817381 RepID=UPI001B307827|nr:hypothetical protein [Patulibacter sp. SYSU D01012]